MFPHAFFGVGHFGQHFFPDGSGVATAIDRGGSVRRRRITERDPWKEREEEAARERKKEEALAEGMLAAVTARIAPAAPEPERDPAPAPVIADALARAAPRPALALVREDAQLPPGPDSAALEREAVERQAKRRKLIARQNAFIILISS